MTDNVMKKLWTALILGSVFSIGTTNSSLYAQAYPDKPVRLVLPFPAGSSTDTVGRIIGMKLSERLGQPIVPENRAGGGSNIGIEYAAKAQPDGYTMLLATNGFTFSPSLYKKLGYNPVRDFDPITMAAQSQQVLAVRKSLPVKNLKELVEYAKANPGKLNYGSSGAGAGSHLVGELFKQVAKIEIAHVPYKGANLAMVALAGGEVDIAVSGITSAMPLVHTGKVTVLAVLSKDRAPLLPNVPTSKEAGVENIESPTWFGLLAPAGTPRNIIAKLNAEWGKVAPMPDTKTKMQDAGFLPLSGTSREFSDFIKAEVARWAIVIKQANIASLD